MITLTNITKSFRSSSVIADSSLVVKPGESYAILGQSGSGKSVFLKMIAGLIQPDSGSIKIETDNVGMLFQKNALFDSLTVGENLDFTLKERTSMRPLEREKLALQYLAWVDLPGTENLYPDELSGGMQKRLGIARALVLKPELILYDEPTAGLDPITSKLIAELILRLRKEMKSTIVTVTSDVFRAFQVADKVGMLLPCENGYYLRTIGSPEEVKKTPHEGVQQFIQGLTKGPLTSAGMEESV